MPVYVDIHVLQTVPPSNVNRDDTGSPKTAVYGGVRRARVSSQAWKRAARKAFADDLDTSDLGVRTRRVVTLVAEEIGRLAPDMSEQSEALAAAALEAAGLKLVPGKKGKAVDEAGPATSGFLVFLSRHQVTRLAELAIAGSRNGTPIDKKAAQHAVASQHSLDVALFGRMIADDKALSVDAAAQVAHALSVHEVDNEYDYFTAVDDHLEGSEPGAGMIGTVEFNSSTLYRYATVNVDALAANLGHSASEVDATARAVVTFLRSFALSMPTGKQNTFANRTRPDAVVVSIRRSAPVNLVGAFEDPVTGSGDRSRLACAADRLAGYSADLDAAYGDGAQQTFVVRVSDATSALDALGERVTMAELLDRLPEAVAARPVPA